MRKNTHLSHKNNFLSHHSEYSRTVFPWSALLTTHNFHRAHDDALIDDYIGGEILDVISTDGDDGEEMNVLHETIDAPQVLVTFTFPHCLDGMVWA